MGSAFLMLSQKYSEPLIHTNVSSLMMPISDPRDRFVCPQHTPIKDTYSLARGLRQLTRDVKTDVRTLNCKVTPLLHNHKNTERRSKKVVVRCNMS